MNTLNKCQIRSDMIVQFYCDHDCDTNSTVKHFRAQNIHRSTIYRAIKRFRDSGSSKFRPITGRPRSVSTKTTTNKIDKRLTRRPETSVSKLALIGKCSKSTALRIKNRLGFKSYTAQPAPKMIAHQEERIKTGATKIYKKLVPSGGGKILIMDDETYVPIDPGQIPGKHFYSQKDGLSVPDEFKFKHKTKFFKKYLVWQAIDQDGNVSDAFIKQGTLKASEYLHECLQSRLLPFIEHHQGAENVLFWPDMSAVHYAKICTDWLRDEAKIEFVGMRENTPNFPQGRPIEKFWALCKAEYAKRTEPAKSLSSFRKIWNNISERVARDSGKSLMQGIKRKLYTVREEGALGPLKIKLPLVNRCANNTQ